MNLTIDNDTGLIEKKNPDQNEIKDILNTIDPDHKAYFILTDEFGSYIQCAGSKDKLTVELREIKDNKFKHYVIRKRDNKISFTSIWTQINCRVGPIRIHETEVLNIEDAIDLFNVFLRRKEISSKYKKRNVTKQFINS
jgi:hypothetical protein